MLFVFALLAITIALFVSDRLRLDIVAILVILALSLSGALTPAQALSGFGATVVIMIAALFVLGEGLQRTGVARSVGKFVTRIAGGNEAQLMVLLMLATAILSAFMSSTGAVAIFIPVVLSICANAGLAPSRLLLPMAFGALIGGMLTLIGTPPNLIVSEALADHGLESFGFFDFTPVGVLVLIVAIVYCLLVAPRLLRSATEARPQRRLSLRDLVDAYGLSTRLHRLRIPPDAKVAGQTLAEALLRTRYDLAVVAAERPPGWGDDRYEPAVAHLRLTPGSHIYALASPDTVATVVAREGLLVAEPDAPDAVGQDGAGPDAAGPDEAGQGGALARDLGLTEVVVPPRSPLVGKTLKESGFRDRTRLTPVGLSRAGTAIVDGVNTLPLAAGDTVLLSGAWRDIRRAADGHGAEILPLTAPAEMDDVAENGHRAPIALVVVLAMLVSLTLGLTAAVTTVILAALAMVATGCVSMKQAYGAINWESIVLIAGMLPMATALEQTGGIDLIVTGLVDTLGAWGLIAIMTGLFVLTSLLSQVISNTATSVLMSPIGIGAAQGLEVSPYPLLMTIAIAASTAFSTPVASPVNTLVLGPGGYRFNDFVRMGVPLQVLALVVTLIAVPLLFPF